MRDVALEAMRLGFERQEQVPPDRRAAADLTPQERAEAWREFVRAGREHSGRLPQGHALDDSRDSIYD